MITNMQKETYVCELLTYEVISEINKKQKNKKKNFNNFARLRQLFILHNDSLTISCSIETEHARFSNTNITFLKTT